MSRILVASLHLMGLLAVQGSEARFTIRRWATEDGLPQGMVSALTQSADGYLWVGTWLGLARFDGVRWTLFDRYNTPVLTNDAINALAGTPDGALYIGTRDGLIRRKQGDWRFLSNLHGLPDRSVWDLAVDHRGRLWLNTEGWAGVFPGGPFEPLDAGRPDLLQPSRKLVPDSERDMVAVTPMGLIYPPVRRAGTEPPRFPWPTNTLPEEFLHSAETDGAGGWWFGTNRRLWHWSAHASLGNAWDKLWSGGWVDHLFRDRRGTLWIGIHGQGLHRLEASVVEMVSLVDSGRIPDVTNLMEDREGSMWVGTDLGLFQIRERLIGAYGPEAAVRSVSEGPDGRVWLATNEGLAEAGRMEGGRDPALHRLAGTGCVIADQNGTLWMDENDNGRHDLLGVRLNGSLIRSLLGERVQALAHGSEGRLWVGTDSGPRCLRDGQLIPLPHLPTGDVRAIHQTRDGAMWFGTNGQGLFRWREGELVPYNREEGLADDRVFAFHEDAEGFLWIGTHNGLTRLEGGAGEKAQWRATTFRTTQGLFDDLINQILEDDSGHLWFSCNRGLFRIARRDLNWVAQGKQMQVVTAVFGEADGMPDNETNGEHQPAGCKTRDGRLWFPTMRGVAVVDPARVSINEVPPQVLIEEMVVDDEEILGDGISSATSTTPFPATLSRGKGTNVTAAFHLEPGRAQTVKFRYSAPTFINAGRVRFRHRLRGLSDAWRDVGTERVAYFNNLKPGDYTFEVVAANAHGAWQKNATAVAITLAPRFTQTPWFPASLVLSGAALAVWLISRRLHWVRRMAAAQEALHLEQERSRIAADLHDDLGSRLTALSLRGQGSGLEEDLLRLAERLRGLIWSVDPASDSLEGLVGYLVDFAERLTAGGGMALSLELPTLIPDLRLGTQARYQLALVVQEALTNSVRHSGGKRVSFQVTLNPDSLVLRTTDDGNGAVTDRPSGRGLSTMRSRMKKLGGELLVESQAGSGTRIEARLPLPYSPPRPHDQSR